MGMDPSSLVELVSAGGGGVARWVREPASGTEVHGAAIDTRELSPGQVFFALAGSRSDGHEHLGAAFAAGSPVAVVSREVSLAPEGLGLLLVEDVGRALLAMASAYRSSLAGVRVIGVTGSNGKTTTVRLIDSILGRGWRGSRSRRSFNNHLGVPLTVLNAGERDAYLVAEIGTNGPGEIASLSGVVRPTLGVITSVGRAHLEGLGSVEGVAAEKGSLLGSLPAGGTGVIPSGSVALEGWLGGAGREAASRVSLVRVGDGDAGAADGLPPADVVARDVEMGESGLVFRCELTSSGRERCGWLSAFEGRYDTPLLGRHNALNAVASIVASASSGVEPRAARAGLARARLPDMRLRSLHLVIRDGADVGPIEVINDAYNANPESMMASLRTARDLAGGRPVVAVLGDMLELGEESPDVHRELGERMVRERWADRVVLIGRMMMFAADRLSREMPNESLLTIPMPGEGWAEEAASLVRPGDVVLVKGSRRMGLESLIDALRGRRPPADDPAGVGG